MTVVRYVHLFQIIPTASASCAAYENAALQRDYSRSLTVQTDQTDSADYSEQICNTTDCLE
jgi:hypothetical protein